MVTQRVGDADAATTWGTGARGSFLLSFTGLLPLALAMPILLLHLYAVGIVVSVLSAAAVIGYHVRRGQGVTALDVAALLFGLLSGVLYFGFHDTTLPEHLGTVFYILLGVQIVWYALRGEPWTLQYARRSAPPILWTNPAFIAGNWASSALWGAGFFVCAALSVLLSGTTIGIYLPLVLLVTFALLTRPLGRWYGTRFAAQGHPV